MTETSGIQQLYQEYMSEHLSHAFLLETNNQEKCLKELLQFLSKINEVENEQENIKLNKLILNETLPSLVVIRPDGNSIKKEQIINLKTSFQTKPIFSKYNMYVILNAEDLNPSSANTILKFLEEPEDFILGFFITDNKENIIDTIRSRCEIIRVNYEQNHENDIPKVWEDLAINYIREYEITGDNTLLYNKQVILPLIHDKKELKYLFQAIFNIYYGIYICKLKNLELKEKYSSLNFVMKKDKNYFYNQVKYIANLLDNLNFNLNTSFVLDCFVLESR